ncbi:hypothetical protein Ancab_022132, partial [Ancistrocladus abbreviatus]
DAVFLFLMGFLSWPILKFSSTFSSPFSTSLGASVPVVLSPFKFAACVWVPFVTPSLVDLCLPSLIFSETSCDRPSILVIGSVTAGSAHSPLSCFEALLDVQTPIIEQSGSPSFRVVSRLHSPCSPPVSLMTGDLFVLMGLSGIRNELQDIDHESKSPDESNDQSNELGLCLLQQL